MRLFAKVYNAAGVLQGNALDIKSVQITKALDAAGSIGLTFSAASGAAALLVEESRVDLYLEQNEITRQVGSGIIRDLTLDDSDTAIISGSGPDSLDALTRKSVLLGRIYNNETIINIASDLVSLVTGWSIDVDSTDSQTARFDGTNVLKALIRVAEEKGLHLREGLDRNSLEMGAFGDDSGIMAVAPHLLSHDLDERDDVLLIDHISRTSSTRQVINWIIPVGGGEGTTALTLKNSTRTAPYAIQSMTGPDGQTLYYLTDDDSIDLYGEIQKIVTFKEINPVAISSAIKILAANALYDAAAAWLQRNAVKLVTYSLNVKHAPADVRPGDKIRVLYHGEIEKEDGSRTPYMEINDLFWVMKTSRTISENGAGLLLEVATIDRREADTTSIVVGAIEAINVRNVSIQPYPIAFSYQDTDIIGSNAPVVFRFRVNDIFTDVTQIKINIHAVPMKSEAYWTSVPSNMLFWQVTPGYNYPSDVSIDIDGVDVTADLGGPWNASGGNAEIDVDADITDYIINASGGLYQDHIITFTCLARTGEVRLDTGYASLTNGQASTGKITATYTVSGSSQAIR